MNFSNHENGENLAFLGIFHFYSTLDYYKIRTKRNFKNSNGNFKFRSTYNNVMYAKRIVRRFYRFYGGKYRNIFRLCCYVQKRIFFVVQTLTVE